MRIGELFAGIGGLGLGLEWSGLGPVVWQVEQDEYARRVLAKHWPEARRYNDVREVGAHNLEPVDLICGGFPCQDISVAGAGAGIEGEQSGLWKEFARVIREMGPRYVIVENVPALAARGLGVVLGDLAECGYDAVWDCISAASVGAPHIRDRLFIVAYANGTKLREQPGWSSRQDGQGSILASDHGQKGHVADAHREGKLQQEGADGKEWRRAGNSGEEANVAHANSRESQVGRQARRMGGFLVEGLHRTPSERREVWTVEPDVGRVAHGVPSRMDRLRCLGNAVVPQVAEVIGGVIIQLEKTCQSTR